MRFEIHIILDFNDLKTWVKKRWVRAFGEPQADIDGWIWGYKYRGTIYSS